MSAEVFFGNPDEEEENLAITILRCIKKVLIFICNLRLALKLGRESVRTSSSLGVPA